MKRQHCINCIFSSWFDTFKRITFRSRIIKLPVDFIEYLKCDGIVLPDAAARQTKYTNELEGYSSDEDDVWSKEGDDSNDTPSFPNLQAQVEKAIKDLGGEVFPKLNWSSPKDATWISHNGTLKCTDFNDICLLLKSSDFITNDVTNAYKYCEDKTPHSVDQFELVLREYVNIVPGMEFRCFVKDHKIIGISQRHDTTCFKYLIENKDRILIDICNFFNRKINHVFAETSFTFDVYISPGNRISLVDFNPFGRITDALLFSWDELLAEDSEYEGTDFRIVTESNNIQPSPYMRYGMPRDIVDLACGEDIQKMIDFLRVKDLVVKPEETQEKDES